MKQAAAVYPAIIHPTDDGQYEVSFPDLPGCVTFGRTLQEAHEKAAEVLSLWLEELAATHQAIPSHIKRPIIADIRAATA